MNRRWLVPGCALFLLALAGPGPGQEAPGKVPPPNWAHWRGPSGQGYSSDATVPLTWSEKENLIWKTPLPGGGNSTPIVWGDRIFLTTAKGRERQVLCLRAGDGKV